MKAKSLLCSEIHGSIKKHEFRTRRNKQIEISKKRIPLNPRTEKQQAQRDRYMPAVEKWNELTEEQKAAWTEIGKPDQITGYNAFMKVELKLVPSEPMPLYSAINAELGILARLLIARSHIPGVLIPGKVHSGISMPAINARIFAAVPATGQLVPTSTVYNALCRAPIGIRAFAFKTGNGSLGTTGTVLAAVTGL